MKPNTANGPSNERAGKMTKKPVGSRLHALDTEFNWKIKSRKMNHILFRVQKHCLSIATHKSIGAIRWPTFHSSFE
jgi:hypothetical protein